MEEICKAIKERRLLKFRYGGIRVVEPYVYGYTRSGEEVLRVSAKRIQQQWKAGMEAF